MREITSEERLRAEINDLRKRQQVARSKNWQAEVDDLQNQIDNIEIGVGNLALDSLVDVDVESPSNDQVLRFNSGSGDWEPDSGLSSLELDVSGLEGTVTSHGNRLSAAEDDIDNLEGDTEALDLRVTAAEGDILTLDGRVDSNDSDISTLQGEMDAAEGRLTVNEGEIDAAQLDILSLDGRLGTAEGDIDDLELFQGTIEGQNLDSRLTVAEGEIGSAQSDILALDGRVDVAEGDIAANEEAIDAIEGRLAPVLLTSRYGVVEELSPSGGGVFGFELPVDMEPGDVVTLTTGGRVQVADGGSARIVLVDSLLSVTTGGSDAYLWVDCSDPESPALVSDPAMPEDPSTEILVGKESGGEWVTARQVSPHSMLLDAASSVGVLDSDTAAVNAGVVVKHDGQILESDGSSWESADVEWENVVNVEVENADIVNVSADKLTAGTVGAHSIIMSDGGTLRSQGYSEGSSGWQVEGGGDAEFNSVVIRGTVHAGSGSDVDWSYISNVAVDNADITDLSADKITSGTVDAATITLDASGVIESDDYVAGTSGFHLDGDGSAEFNDVTVRGAIEAGAGSDVDWSYIKNVSIENADIDNVSADKITAGTIGAEAIEVASGGSIASSDYVAGTSGWKIDGAGDAELNDVTVRGDLISGSGDERASIVDGVVTVGEPVAGNAVRMDPNDNNLSRLQMYVNGYLNGQITATSTGLYLVFAAEDNSGDSSLELGMNYIRSIGDFEIHGKLAVGHPFTGIDDVEAAINAAEADISTLQGDVSDVEAAIDSLRRLEAPPYNRRERASTNQSIPNSSTTTVSFNSTAYQQNVSGFFSVTASTITIQRDGLYHVEAGIAWEGGTSAGIRIIRLMRNSGTIRYFAQPGVPGQTVAPSQVSYDGPLSAGDEIEVMAFQNTGSSHAVLASEHTFRSIRWVGDLA